MSACPIPTADLCTSPLVASSIMMTTSAVRATAITCRPRPFPGQEGGTWLHSDMGRTAGRPQPMAQAPAPTGPRGLPCAAPRQVLLLSPVSLVEMCSRSNPDTSAWGAEAPLLPPTPTPLRGPSWVILHQLLTQPAEPHWAVAVIYLVQTPENRGLA